MKTRFFLGIFFLALTAAILIIVPAAVADPTCDALPAGLIGYEQSILGDALGIDVQGNYAYVADWGGVLQVFDVSDPCNPQRLGSAWTPGNEFGDLTVVGDFAYVANDGNGLSKYNIADPNAPFLVTWRNDATYAHDVFYDGGQYAFAGYIYSSGRELAIYDMTAYPGATPTFYSPTFPGHRDIYSVDVVGNRAYVCASAGDGNGHFQIVDISTITAPHFISEIYMPLNQYGDGCAVRVQGDHAYLTTAHYITHNGGLIVVNIANESAPFIQGELYVPDAAIVPWKKPGLDILDQTVYMMAQHGLYVLDVTDPAHPVQVDYFPFPAEFGHISGGQVVVRDDLAYAAVYRFWPPSPGDHAGLAIYRLQPANQPPVVDAGGPYTGSEGLAIDLSAAAQDPEEDALTFAWTADSPLCAFSDSTKLQPQVTCRDNGDFIVTLTVDDGVNDPVSSSADVSVANLAPVIEQVMVSADPVKITDQPVQVTATFSDPAGAYDEPFVCTFDYGDSSGLQAGTVAGTTCTGSNHIYLEAGVYSVQVRVTDKDNGTGIGSAANYIVVYDPSGGFVTGGGWILSPAGAFSPDPSLTGKANFGFVAKYKNGASIPTGNMEFVFKVADLNFHSESYDWLVVAGARATFKGTGTLNGSGSYGFMLTAVDEGLTPSTDVDLFRIKIWDKTSGEIIYDNQLGADDNAMPTTAIGGGSIVIHKTK